MLRLTFNLYTVSVNRLSNNPAQVTIELQIELELARIKSPVQSR